MTLLDTGGRDVPPEWIDYNGHMMDAYYFLAFTEATEAFLDHLGLGAAYRARTGAGIYTAESHLCFLAGVTAGTRLAYRTQLLGHDAKRLHVFHQMTVAQTLTATCELMFLHVSDGHVTPMPPEAAQAAGALAAGQAALPRPARAGRRIAMPSPGLPVRPLPVPPRIRRRRGIPAARHPVPPAPGQRRAHDPRRGCGPRGGLVPLGAGVTRGRRRGGPGADQGDVPGPRVDRGRDGGGHPCRRGTRRDGRAWGAGRGGVVTAEDDRQRDRRPGGGEHSGGDGGP